MNLGRPASPQFNLVAEDELSGGTTRHRESQHIGLGLIVFLAPA
jgi:hypothetical protein